MKILLIEDEPMIRKGISKLLHQANIKEFNIGLLVEAENAEEADQILQSQTFDFIFTDIEMGEKNGLELLEKWSSKLKETQWVIISGYDHFEYAQQAIRLGVKEYLLKPVTRKKLRETIIHCLDIKNNRSKYDFVESRLLDDLIFNIEDAIWSIDQKKLHGYFNNWKKYVEAKKFDITYYQDLLTHAIETILNNLNERGSRIAPTSDRQMHGETVEETNTFFIQRCESLIEIIELKRKGNEIDPIEAAKQFIAKNIEHEVSLDEVAHRLGLNSSYFSQLFKKETGETFVKYRIRLRMEKAKELLLQGDIRVIDIPGMIGLNDHPHFTKTFKKYTGQTPTEFRNIMGII